jgi:LVIVD repeat
MAAWGDHLYIIQGAYLVRADLNGHWDALADQNGNNQAWGGSSSMAALGNYLYVVQGRDLVRVDPNNGSWQVI